MARQTKEEAAAIYCKAAGHVILMGNVLGIGMSTIMALSALYASPATFIFVLVCWGIVCVLANRSIRTAKFARKFISEKGRIPASQDELLAYIDSNS